MNPPPATDQLTGAELSEYNRIAIQNAAKLHEFRSATRQPDRTDLPIEPDDSKQIVTTLLAQHGRPEYICRFPWKADSIAFWDNRAVQHYAASDYYPHKRVLRRVTISGDRPYNNLD